MALARSKPSHPADAAAPRPRPARAPTRSTLAPDVHAQHERLERAFGAPPEPEIALYPAWVRAGIVVGLSLGSWAGLLAAAVAAKRLLP